MIYNHDKNANINIEIYGHEVKKINIYFQEVYNEGVQLGEVLQGSGFSQGEGIPGCFFKKTWHQKIHTFIVGKR